MTYSFARRLTAEAIGSFFLFAGAIVATALADWLIKPEEAQG